MTPTTEPTLTDDWVETFYASVIGGENPADSIFWRLAVDVLPEGVDQDDPRVIVIIARIKEALESRKEPQ
jgi:hypothetical protein